MTKSWIIVASRDHVQNGVADGFAQACHGKCAPLKRMKTGDNVIYYSSKLHFGHPAPCQAFTAIGTVVDDEVFAVAMSETFIPFRRRVAFMSAQEVAIQPLIPSLSFIVDKQRWGAPFRFGMLAIPQTDYEQIAAAMVHPVAVGQ